MHHDLSKEILKATWVTAPAAFAAPRIIRTFSVRGAADGRIAVSALGFFTLFLNGRRVGEDYFTPANSIFHARPNTDWIYPINDDFTYRCYYKVYDLSAYLQEGENALEIALGDGWYRQYERTAEGTMTFGDTLAALYALSLTDDDGDRLLLSDGSEHCRTTATVYSQLFRGEIFDARIERDAAYEYAPVGTRTLPDTLLTPDDTQPDRVVRRLSPTLLGEKDGRRIYDAGENISGFVTLRITAGDGERVTVRFAEEIADGEPDFGSTGCRYVTKSGDLQVMEDVFIGDGREHIFEPQFVWHAFRYFDVAGDGEPLSVAVVHADTPVTADFHSGSPVLDWLFDAFVRTQLNNMHGGVPSDCPHRERLGYTGDGQVAAPAAMAMLNCRAFYRKWIRDIFDSQCKTTGHVNHTAPFTGGGGGPGGWGCAAILVPYAFYKNFGDTEPFLTYYDRMLAWVDYMLTRRTDGLVDHEEGGWCLGDWSFPEEGKLPMPLVNTCYLIKMTRLMEEIAVLTGHEADIPHLTAARDEAVDAILSHYWDDATGSFAGGIQGADAFALYAGLGDDRTFRNLAEKYRALGRFDTGFLGTDILAGLLMEGGEGDLALTLISADEVGGYGSMLSHGATTVWESWHGWDSHDHPMFGGCARLLFSAILGIRQPEGNAGFNELLIAPVTPRSLPFAKGSRLVGGDKVAVAWEREADTVRFDITVPTGRRCTFRYGGDTRELPAGRSRFTLPAADM